jgi:hypothetical protein
MKVTGAVSERARVSRPTVTVVPHGGTEAAA